MKEEGALLYPNKWSTPAFFVALSVSNMPGSVPNREQYSCRSRLEDGVENKEVRKCEMVCKPESVLRRRSDTRKYRERGDSESKAPLAVSASAHITHSHTHTLTHAEIIFPSVKFRSASPKSNWPPCLWLLILASLSSRHAARSS